MAGVPPWDNPPVEPRSLESWHNNIHELCASNGDTGRSFGTLNPINGAAFDPLFYHLHCCGLGLIYRLKEQLLICVVIDFAFALYQAKNPGLWWEDTGNPLSPDNLATCSEQ